ncbi:hypothetical protein TYRP_009462 [Tyrophagus putrescentiae]|nr:hypothetical protein TYRP_009462 [Tyrophagus putrescentiae]
MGDSDDEYDRRGRGRDKFRRERNDYADARPPVDVGGGGPGGPGGPVGGSVGGGSLGGGLSRRNDWGDR